jgi:NAD-dependent deacetylase
MSKLKMTVLTGAGMSAESGISTFRDADGLWEGHDVMEVASPEGWRRNPALVLKFYNDRRRQLYEVVPNSAHEALVQLELSFDVTIVTQNVDDLHERAGSTDIIHLHGELRKARSSKSESWIQERLADIKLGELAPDGSQIRPHIVWFGEAVPLLEKAAKAVSQADIILVIGSSMQVYPAAGLVAYASEKAKIIYIDPKPALNFELKQRKDLLVLAEKATSGMEKILGMFKS